MSAPRLLSLSVIRPSMEYGIEVWECNKSDVGSLKSVILNGASWILGCSSKTYNEVHVVRGNMGLDTLQIHTDTSQLKCCYKHIILSERIYPKQLFNQKWNIKPRRRQRKVWSGMVGDLFKSLDIHR